MKNILWLAANARDTLDYLSTCSLSIKEERSLFFFPTKWSLKDLNGFIFFVSKGNSLEAQGAQPKCIGNSLGSVLFFFFSKLS
jgi:hypothetical protein